MGLKARTPRRLAFYSGLCFLWMAAMVMGAPLAPTLYEVDNKGDEAVPVMVPVSSTVIPLDDLPVFQVGFGFGLEGAQKGKKQKPSNLKDIQLITAKNQHRFVALAGVAELTKEEFEKFNLQ